ncbi:hypothetical protein PAMA_010114 [Pampus argenteus]
MALTAVVYTAYVLHRLLKMAVAALAHVVDQSLQSKKSASPVTGKALTSSLRSLNLCRNKPKEISKYRHIAYVVRLGTLTSEYAGVLSLTTQVNSTLETHKEERLQTEDLEGRRGENGFSPTAALATLRTEQQAPPESKRIPEVENKHTLIHTQLTAIPDACWDISQLTSAIVINVHHVSNQPVQSTIHKAHCRILFSRNSKRTRPKT